MVSRGVHHGNTRFPENRLALLVAREIGIARLVLDVVTEIHDEIRVHLVEHAPHEAFGEFARAMAHLSELSAVADLGPEVQIRDDAERESHYGPSLTRNEKNATRASPRTCTIVSIGPARRGYALPQRNR